MIASTIPGSRSYLIIAAAIVIASVLISASVFVAVGGAKTATTTFTRITTVASTGARLYAVTFQQVRYCGQYNIMPWAVTIGGLTQVQPSNQTLPLPTGYSQTVVPDQNLTRMTFSLESSVYNYTVSGGGGFVELYPGSGTFQVSGSDVVVNLQVFLSFTCTSTSTGP